MSAIINALRKSLEAAPANWELRHALIEAYLGEGKKHEAYGLLHEIDSLPEDEDSLISAAHCYAAAGSGDDAIRIVQSVLDANPANASAHLARATLADAAGDSASAMRHFITATSLDPSLSSPPLEAKYGNLMGGAAPTGTGTAQEKVDESAPAIAEAKPEAATVAEPETVEPEAEVEVEVAPEAEEAPAVAAVEPEGVVVAAVDHEPEPAVDHEPEPAVDHEPEPAAEPEPEGAAPPEMVIAKLAPVEKKNVEDEAPEAPDKEDAVTSEEEQQSEEVGKKSQPTVLAAKASDDDTVAAPVGAATVKLQTLGNATVKLAEKEADVEAALDEREHHRHGEPAPAAAIHVSHDDLAEGHEPDELEMHLKEIQDDLENQHQRDMRRDKLASLTVTVLLHLGIGLALALVVISVPQDVPPQIVAQHMTVEKEEEMTSTTVQRTQVRPTTTASATSDVVTVVGSSSISMSNVEFDGLSQEPSIGMSFEPSMSFGDVSSSMDSKMMFGQKMEGDVLGVVLDVSGSMAEYLPMVIREVDKNFKNAPIVYVNHGEMLGTPNGTDLYPIIKEEVMPRWTLEDGRIIRSPYWFLWYDLPRKAPQKSVDRLIGIFKDRPNMFIARGGRNLIGAAAEFLIDQKCDSLYIFSDWEDFVDKEYCEILGQKLGRAKVRTYVQPAAARTDHLHTVSLQVANGTKGREMPPLTHLLRPDETEQVSLLAKLEDEKKVPPPEGVQFATRRETRDGPGVLKNYGYWDSGDWKERFGTELKVVEYPNFDIVLVGPEARAFIYLKTPEGYIQSPIIFGYHSHKPYIASDGKTRHRRRKWLRNAEEPTFDGKEFSWSMILEDEIEFKVMFWFKEDTVTGTYIAEKPPEGQTDGAFIYFRVPPLAREDKDRYFGVDFPDGLTLDDLRQAMTYNVGNFYLPALAADRMETTWNRLGFKRGDNLLPYNVMYRTLPDAVREMTVSGPSFGPRKLQARTINNNLLLNTYTRADMELWEGFLATLVRPSDRRERLSRAEAIAFSVE